MRRTVANRRRVGARAAAVLAALGLALGAALATAPAASAHSVLLSSSPAAGSSVATSPEDITLAFNEPIQASTMEVAVTASSRVVVTEEKPTVSGTIITQKLPPDLPNDTYTVAYRVISVDGHPVSESLTFSVDDPASTQEPLGANDVPYQVGGSKRIAQGETALYAKVLYLALPLLIGLLVVGVVRTRGRYRVRNPKEDGDGLVNPFMIPRAKSEPETPQEHIHTRPDITRDRDR